jgi:hypothetical protein
MNEYMGFVCKLAWIAKPEAEVCPCGFQGLCHKQESSGPVTAVHKVTSKAEVRSLLNQDVEVQSPQEMLDTQV